MVGVTVIRTRFVPSYKREGRSPGFGTFKQFMVSDQIRKPLRMAALDMIALAKASVSRSDDPRSGKPGKPHYTDAFSLHTEGLETLVFDGRVGRWNPHAMVQISNHAQNAIALEFGSGDPSEGLTGGRERQAKQGGWNKAKRPLGRAGRAIGRAVEEK